MSFKIPKRCYRDQNSDCSFNKPIKAFKICLISLASVLSFVNVVFELKKEVLKGSPHETQIVY